MIPLPFSNVVGQVASLLSLCQKLHRGLAWILL